MARESSVLLVLVGEEQVPLRDVDCTVPKDMPHHFLEVGELFLE